MSETLLNRLRQGLIMPPAGWTLAGLLAFYVLAGLFGHDPWKSEDAIHLGVAHDMLSQGNWWAPELAGRLWIEPPLYYWSAALTGQLLDWLLPLHSAMRLASGLWVALALVGIYFAGRELYGQEAAAASPLLLAGSAGLMVLAHEAQPMLVALAAYCGALGALAAMERKTTLAGPFYGLSLAGAFLAVGLAVTLPLLAAGLLLLALRRLPEVRQGVLVGLAVAVAVVGAVFAGLWQAAPEFWRLWWAGELAQLGGAPSPVQGLLRYLSMLPWFAWPAFPVACWGLWIKRRQLKLAHLLRPLVVLGLTLATLVWCYPPRQIAAILLLPPLALLATPSVLALRRGAANALDWFSKMTFSFFAILAWIGWSALVFGWPEKLAKRAVVLEPGFVGQFHFFPFVLALGVTAFWGWLMWSSPRSPYRGLTHWTAGFTTVWLLLASLWLPWIDYGKSYRSLSQQLARQLPEDEGCVAEKNVGDAQRASFAYFAQIRLLPAEEGEAKACRWLLVQGNSRTELAPTNGAWVKLWEGNRQGDRAEKFRLYRRD